MGFTTTRTLIPETDEVEFRVTYASDIVGRVTMESVIRDGESAVRAMVERLTDQLTYDILKDLG